MQVKNFSNSVLKVAMRECGGESMQVNGVVGEIQEMGLAIVRLKNDIQCSIRERRELENGCVK